MNRKAIALNYIWGWFWLDLLTSAPTHILQCMVRSLRAVHVLRITNLLIGVLRLNRAVGHALLPLAWCHPLDLWR